MSATLMQMSLSAGVLIIAIMLLRAVALNRLPKITFLLLWGVVLIRLLVPFSFASPFRSSQPLLEREVVSQGIVLVLPTETSVTHIEPEQSSINILPIIWLPGFAVAAVFFAIIYIKCRRELRFALPVANSPFLIRWLARHRLLRPMAVLETDRITTPIAAGLAKPRIILPKTMDKSNERLMLHVLTHEYCHIKRLDALWKMLMAAAICLHWFNPLVWVMFLLVNRDLELTCDEMVLRRLDADARSNYAHSIISLAESRRRFAPLTSGFSKNAVKERIEAIMKMKRNSIISILLAAVLVIGAGYTVMALGDNEAVPYPYDYEEVVEEYVPDVTEYFPVAAIYDNDDIWDDTDVADHIVYWTMPGGFEYCPEHDNYFAMLQDGFGNYIELRVCRVYPIVYDYVVVVVDVESVVIN